MDSEKIIAAVSAVTGKWARQRKTEERDAQAKLRRREVLTRYRRVTKRRAAWAVMEDAYLKASAAGTLPAHARQIMYAARPEIQKRTGSLVNDQYFTQGLLPDYIIAHPEETATWDVVYDARGHFQEPHTNHKVSLGTLDVRKYLKAIQDVRASGYKSVEIVRDQYYPTKNPVHRYNAILFIEKEGFMPLFEQVQLANPVTISP